MAPSALFSFLKTVVAIRTFSVSIKILELFVLLLWKCLQYFDRDYIGSGIALGCMVNSVQLLSHVWFCDPMDCSMPGLPVHHQLLDPTQTHVHRVGDAIQPSHPLSSPSPPAFNLSQHQGLLKWVRSSHQVAKVLEFQLQHQSFQWTLRTDLL